jgi:hypothetical protein
VLCSAGRFAEAIKELTAALAIQSWPHTRRSLASALFGAQRFDEAIAEAPLAMRDSRDDSFVAACEALIAECNRRHLAGPLTFLPGEADLVEEAVGSADAAADMTANSPDIFCSAAFAERRPRRSTSKPLPRVRPR